jgi:hypothetical protein|tara:strand:+ start:1090 stop:1359 length:270 start_codon:yes stop_codon:yes gene_type:complete
MGIKKNSKLENQELQQLKDFQSEIDKLTFSLGQIALQRIKTDIDESMAKNKYQELLELEKKIGENLNNKYGEVQIDLKTGKITSSDNES